MFLVRTGAHPVVPRVTGAGAAGACRLNVISVGGLVVGGWKLITGLLHPPVRSMPIRVGVSEVATICHVRCTRPRYLAKDRIEDYKRTPLPGVVLQEIEELLLLDV